MKALILYFSGTGNTKFVAEKFDHELKSQNIETEIHSIEENFSIEPDSYDLLILGCPKYYEYPVLFFIDHLKQNLPTSKKSIPVLSFCTQTGPLETNFKGIEKLLTHKNHKLVVSKSFPIANNFLIFKAFKQTDKQDAIDRIKQISPQVKTLVANVLKESSTKEQVGGFKGGMEHAVAVSCNKLFPVFAMKYSASEQCIGCGLCAKKCPKQNITMNNNKPEFGKDCIFCMRCINLCPTNAILYHDEKVPQYHMEKIEL